ncbi:hypothetical protein ACTQ6A_14425 [Lachnospiraceae bacterium LCP25S3_G4]
MLEQGLLLEILKQLQKKHQGINEFYNLSKNLGDALSRDDRVSAQLIIQMRQEEIIKVEEYQKNIALLINSMPEQERYKVEDLMEQLQTQEEDFACQKIVEISKNIKSVIERCIALDKGMSKRMAGVDSFYIG